MVQIFSFFGSILGYLLWFLYNIFHNYGVAIIFFSSTAQQYTLRKEPDAGDLLRCR